MKKRAVILLNGEISNPSLIRLLLTKEPLIIAADGGARHAATLGVKIDCLLGDLDSIAPELLSKLEHDQVPTIKFPVNKDQTDLELSLMYALKQGIEEVHLLGIEGGRLDHLLGVFGIFANETFFNLKLWGYHGLQSITRVKAGENLQLNLAIGSRFSLIALTNDVEGLSLCGVKWPLHKASLSIGSGRGISNEASQQAISLELSQGVILVCLEGTIE